MCAGKRILLSSVERTRASSCQRTPPRNPPSEPTPPTVTGASLHPPASFPSATLPATLSLSRAGFLFLASPCNPPRVLSGTPGIEENRMKRETFCARERRVLPLLSPPPGVSFASASRGAGIADGYITRLGFVAEIFGEIAGVLFRTTAR